MKNRGRKTSGSKKVKCENRVLLSVVKKNSRNKRGNCEIIKNRYCLRKLFVSSVLCNKNKTKQTYEYLDLQHINIGKFMLSIIKG